MNDHDLRPWMTAIMSAASRLEQLGGQLEGQARQAQKAMQATRETEERQLRQALVSMFDEQQQRTAAALRPQLLRAWQLLAVLAAVGLLVFGGFVLLIERAHHRADLAQARADRLEIASEVQQALQHVQITSCGGRPCVRLDRKSPVWNSPDGEYVLVDGRPARQRR